MSTPTFDVSLVTIYTDGACIGNPGPGGYGVVILRAKERLELSGGFRRTTNNRMEMLAAIVGLETLDSRQQVLLHSDSRYLVDAVEKGWARKWRANGWMRNPREAAVNPDLWERMLDVLERHNVRMKWVRGHAGNRENERCDVLATTAARKDGLAIDSGYERLPERLPEPLPAPRPTQRDFFAT